MKVDWIEVELGEVFFTTSGGTPSRRNSSYYEGTIPWVKSGELDKGIIKGTEENITFDAVKNSSAKIFPKGTLLIALYGATIGKLAFLGVDAATNQAICGIYQNENISHNFLFYFLLYSRSKLISKGSGGAQPNISQTILKKLLFPIIPLPIQRAIVSKIEALFSDLDSGIANLKKAQEQLKIYRQAVLKKAFEGELTKEWRKDKARLVLEGKTKPLPTGEELLQQIKEEREKNYELRITNWKKAVKEWEKNEKEGKKPKRPQKPIIPDAPDAIQQELQWSLPNNWLWTQLGEICFVTKLAGFEYTDYVKYEPDGDLTVLKAENVSINGFKRTQFSKVHSQKVNVLTRSELFGGELLIVFVGAGTGNVAVVPNNKKYFLGPNIGMARPYVKLNSNFIEYFYRAAFGKDIMMVKAKAVAQPSLSMGTIRQAPLVLPPLNEQSQIVLEIETRLSVCDKVEQSITESLEKAKALRQSILKKAFEGKLLTEQEIEQCKQEPDYEPASVLLEKIKEEKSRKEKARIASKKNNKNKK